jgi:hypothetical protein
MDMAPVVNMLKYNAHRDVMFTVLTREKCSVLVNWTERYNAHRDVMVAVLTREKCSVLVNWTERYNAHRDVMFAVLTREKCSVLVNWTETCRSHSTSNLHEAPTGNLSIIQTSNFLHIQNIVTGITISMFHFLLCYYFPPVINLHPPVLHFVHTCYSKLFSCHLC